MSSEERKNNKQEEIKRQPEGYESIIPDNVFDKVLKVKEAVKELHEELSNLSKSMLNEGRPSPYQMFQYVNFNSFVDEIHRNTELATQIHRLNKDFIDEVAKEQGMTTQEYVSAYMIGQLLDMLKK